MEPNKQALGIVIRADGTVPFDDDFPHVHRGAIMAHLLANGAQLHPVHGTPHIRIANWDHDMKTRIAGVPVAIVASPAS